MKDQELAQLYPNLSPEKLEEAKENLDQYLLLAWEIWEEEQASLTRNGAEFRIKAKVESTN